ncbi:MAG: Stage V sporulation protein D [Actinobacteria bacterium ADurb.Bin346]|nr:MAG: Stage V sporulation protein D [Actinobacteria bacterium ADurb.Bin346]
MNILSAIQNSCDIYFYEVGYELFLKNSNSDELLQKYARLFGFGANTGVDLPYEDTGIIPDKDWKKEYFKEQKDNTVWFPGDTVNMAIGQGDLLVTPLQMANAYAILVNRGIKNVPHFGMEVRDENGDVFTKLGEGGSVDLEMNKEYMDLIEQGLKLVVSQGTAASRFMQFPLKKIPVAGKTGTAEVIGKQDYGWFVTYAPAGNPEYIIVVMLEQAGGGSNSAAPIAEKIYEYLFNLGYGE